VSASAVAVALRALVDRPAEEATPGGACPLATHAVRAG
jgi:hypothetical protein